MQRQNVILSQPNLWCHTKVSVGHQCVPRLGNRMHACTLHLGRQWISCDDVFAFDFTNCQWKALEITGVTMPRRRGHSAGLVSNRSCCPFYPLLFNGREVAAQHLPTVHHNPLVDVPSIYPPSMELDNWTMPRRAPFKMTHGENSHNFHTLLLQSHPFAVFKPHDLRWGLFVCKAGGRAGGGGVDGTCLTFCGQCALIQTQVPFAPPLWPWGLTCNSSANVTNSGRGS